MNLKLVSIHNHGDASKEHVVLEATADCDVGAFLIMDSTYTSDNKVSNKLRHTYWFPDKKIKKGEKVSLWTTKGTNTEGDMGGTKVHRFYWGLASSVWNDDGDAAVLFYAPEWTHLKAK